MRGAATKSARLQYTVLTYSGCSKTPGAGFELPQLVLNTPIKNDLNEVYKFSKKNQMFEGV